MTEPKLSQTDYVNRGGGECPWCGSIDLQGHEHLFDEDTAELEVTCDLCGKAWTEEYKLSGYREEIRVH